MRVKLHSWVHYDMYTRRALTEALATTRRFPPAFSAHAFYILILFQFAYSTTTYPTILFNAVAFLASF